MKIKQLIIYKLKKIKRPIKYWFQRRIRGWSDDECWNLDYHFIKWVNSRFKKYKEQAIKIVDLEFKKFTYKKKVYTQLELIDKVIELTDEFIDGDYWDVDITTTNLEKIKNEIFDIFKLIYWHMWW